MNVLEWSLFYRNKIGVTLYFIDRGIDTGDILMFEEINIERGDTIASLRADTKNINVSLMAEAIKLLKEGKAIRRQQKKEEGKQYFVMHDRLRKIIKL